MKLRNTSRIPPIPPIHQKLLHAWERDALLSGEVAELLEQDAFLHPRVLAGFRALHPDSPEPVEGIQQAVSRSGAGMVIHIALCASVYDLFRAGPTSRDVGPLARPFWGHALECGVLAFLLAEGNEYGRPDQAFLAGFLHDIGKQVLWVCQPDDYETLLQEAGNREDLLLQGETRLGGTHPAVGAWMARRWGLSPFLADAIQYHHESAARVADALPLVRLVHQAHELCRRDVRAEDSWGTSPRPSPRALSFDTPDLLARAEPMVGALALALEIDAAPPPAEIGPSKGAFSRWDVKGGPGNGDLFFDALENLIGAGSAEGIFAALQNGMDRVFGLKSLLVFRADSERDALRAAHGSRRGLEDDLIVPFATRSSLLVQAFEEGDILDSFSGAPEGGPALVDEQVLGFLGTEGFLALPLRGAETVLGVAVLGVGEARLYELSVDLRPIRLLVRQAGFALEGAELQTPVEQAPRAERPGALQALARRVVHEANGPLGIIKNYLKILDLKLNENHLEQDEIRIISEEIDRVAQILERLRALADDSPRDPEPLDVNGLITDLARIMKDSLLGNAGVQLQLVLQPDLPLVLGDRDGLKQVLINLVHNAVESMETGGNLFIRTAGSNHRPKGLQAAGGAVKVTVEDDGPGVPEEIRPHLFRPFQGTKGGRHAGLGLSIVQTLVTGMGGRIEYAEGEAGGASFSFSIPAYPENRSQ